QSIEDVFSARIWQPALGCMLLLIFFEAAFSTVRSFEGLAYDLAFWFAVLTLDWLVALCWMQFIRIWSELRELLQALERHPLRKAFARLQKQVAWVPRVTKPTEHRYLMTSRCVGTLLLLASLYETASTPILDIRTTLKEAGGVDELYGKVVSGSAKDPDVVDS